MGAAEQAAHAGVKPGSELSYYLQQLEFVHNSHPYSQHVYMLESAMPEAYACFPSTPNPWEALESC